MVVSYVGIANCFPQQFWVYCVSSLSREVMICALFYWGQTVAVLW